MKFVYAGAFRFPNLDAASQRVLNNAKILRELGHEVVFIAYGGKLLEEYLSPDGFSEYDGFKYTVTNELTPSGDIFNRLKQQIRRGEKAQALISKNFSSWEVIQYNTYFSSQWSDITEWYSPLDFQGGICSYGYWRSEYNMLLKQKRVPKKIVISRYLDKYYSGSHNIIIPPLIDLKDSKWNNIVKDLPRQIASHTGRRIIFAGVPAKKDLLKNAIQALCTCVCQGNRSLQLIVVGVSERESLLYCSNEQLNLLNQNIVFVGRVSQDLVPAYYKLADASIIIRERTRKNMAGFPTKMAESMAAGCPVIMTKTSDLEDYVKDGDQGIIISDTKVDSIVNGFKILNSISNEKLRYMKDSSKKLSVMKFDWRNYVSSMRDFIEIN